MALPGRDAGSNRTTSSGRKIRRKGPPTPKKKSTTPKVQPGPYRASERKRVETFKRTPTYRAALREARKKGPATRRGTRRPGGDDKSAADRARAEAYVKALYRKRYGRDLGTIRRKSNGTVVSGYRSRTTVPPDVQERSDLVRGAERATASRTAPVAKVLEQTLRPVHAVAAAAKEDVKSIKAGKSPVGNKSYKAALRGLQLKDKTLFSDVLKEAGVKNKAVAGTLGFALDVAADPTTYLTLGASAPAKQAAISAARKAEAKAARSAPAKEAGKKATEQAVKRGAAPKDAKRAGKQAARKNARRAGQKAGQQAAKGKATNTGLSVRFAGRSVPVVTRSTAAAKRAPRKVADKTKVTGTKADRAQQRVRDTVRNLGSDFNPAIAPAGVDRVAYQSARRSARTARARAQRGTYRAGQRAVAFQRAIGKDNYERVIDAIETGTVKSLPANLRAPARELERDFARMRKTEVRAGIKVGDVTKKKDGPKGYVKQLRVKDEDRRGSPSVGSKKVSPSYAKKRTEGTIAEKNAREPGAYSTDIADIYLNRGAESAVSVAKAKLNQAMLQAGRKVDRDRKVSDQLGDDEMLYRVEGSDLVKIDPKTAEYREPRKGGRYVILNEKMLARTRGTVQSAAERSTAGVFFDRAQGVWKLAATQINPGYHVRNLAGEAQNAYLASRNPITLGKTTVQAARALRQLGREEDALRVLGKDAKQKYTGIDVREAEDVGAVRAGQLGREVREMLGPGSKKSSRLKSHARTATRKPARVLQNAEDVFRLATYKAGLDRGLSPEKAMERASRFHFDYGDLTPLERDKLRRVFPFYTFSARNIPLQLKTLVQRPGKFANYEKARQELAKAFGIPQDWQTELSEYEQRGAPFPVKIDGKNYNIGLGPSGLPLTDLNEMPVSGDPRKAVDEWISRSVSMLTPAGKTPLELWANMSFFFRDTIERDEGPLAPAPSWVKHIPKPYRDELGIVSDLVDKQTGKKTWGAPAKLVFALGVLPGPANFANRLATESDRPGQSKENKTLAYFGPRVRQNDPLTVTINDLYDTRQDVSKEAAALRQRGVSAANPTPEYRELLEREKQLTSEIMRLKTKRGDVVEGGRKPSSGSTSDGFKWSDGGGGSTTSDGFKWSD